MKGRIIKIRLQRPVFLPLGFSYLGKIVVLYTIEHPNRVNRIVQVRPVARKFGTKSPAALTAADEDNVPDPAENRRMEILYKSGFAQEHRKEYCGMEWKVEQRRMVGNPLLASDQPLDIPKEAIAKVTAPVLTIHGRKDRNA
jgi:pimeloyl-ACP methyl ester carboxylesterase